MKKILSILLFCLGTAASACWAQTGADQASATSDPIVQMHQRISAANRTYDAKVAAAKKVFLQQKAVAAKERDAAIAAARGGVPSAESQ